MQEIMVKIEERCDYWSNLCIKLTLENVKKWSQAADRANTEQRPPSVHCRSDLCTKVVYTQRYCILRPPKMQCNIALNWGWSPKRGMSIKVVLWNMGSQKSKVFQKEGHSREVPLLYCPSVCLSIKESFAGFTVRISHRLLVTQVWLLGQNLYIFYSRQPVESSALINHLSNFLRRSLSTSIIVFVIWSRPTPTLRWTVFHFDKLIYTIFLTDMKHFVLLTYETNMRITQKIRGSAY